MAETPTAPPPTSDVGEDAASLVKLRAKLKTSAVIRACIKISSQPIESAAHLKRVLRVLDEPSRLELLPLVCEALWADKKHNGRATCLRLMGHTYFTLPRGSATAAALGSRYLEMISEELAAKSSTVFVPRHEALGPSSFASFLMGVSTRQLASAAIPVMLQLCQRLAQDAELSLQPLSRIAVVLGPQASRSELLPALRGFITGAKHTKHTLRALARQLIRPRLAAALELPAQAEDQPAAAAAPGAEAAAEAAAPGPAASASAEGGGSGEAAASALVLSLLEALARASCREDSGPWGVADCLQTAYQGCPAAGQAAQRLLPLLQELAAATGSIHSRCTAAYLLSYAHQVLGQQQEALVRQLLLQLMGDGSAAVRGAAASQLQLLSRLVPLGSDDAKMVSVLSNLAAALTCSPGNKESTTPSTHLAQLLVLATHLMLPPGPAAPQLQWWKALKPAFLAALALHQPHDDEDFVLVQQVAVAQVQRLAQHLPAPELLGLCRDLAGVKGKAAKGKAASSHLRAKLSACVLLTTCYSASAASSSSRWMAVEQLQLLLRDPVQLVRLLAAQQLLPLVQATQEALEVQRVLLPLLAGVLCSKDELDDEHVKSAAAGAISAVAAHLDAGTFRALLLPLLQALAQDSLEAYRAETEATLERLALGEQQRCMDVPVARVPGCTGDCALRLAAALQMEALAGWARQCGDPQLMLDLVLLQLQLLQDPAAPVSQAARRGLLQACSALGLDALLAPHILPALHEAVGAGGTAGTATATGREAAGAAVPAGYEAAKASASCSASAATPSVSSVAMAGTAAGAGGSGSSSPGEEATGAALRLVACPGGSSSCGSPSSHDGEGEAPVAKRRKVSAAQQQQQRQQRRRQQQQQQQLASPPAASTSTVPEAGPLTGAAAAAADLVSELGDDAAAAWDTSAGEGMAAAAGFICELAACLPPAQALEQLLPLALAVLSSPSYPQPVVELLGGAAPLCRAAAAVNPTAVAQLQASVLAAAEWVAAGRWPQQSRLYIADVLQQRLATALPVLAAALPAAAARRLLQLAVGLLERHDSRAVVQAAAQALPSLLKASQAAEAAGSRGSLETEEPGQTAAAAAPEAAAAAAADGGLAASMAQRLQALSQDAAS